MNKNASEIQPATLRRIRIQVVFRNWWQLLKQEQQLGLIANPQEKCKGYNNEQRFTKKSRSPQHHKHQIVPQLVNHTINSNLIRKRAKECEYFENTVSGIPSVFLQPLYPTCLHSDGLYMNTSSSNSNFEVHFDYTTLKSNAKFHSGEISNKSQKQYPHKCQLRSSQINKIIINTTSLLPNAFNITQDPHNLTIR